MAMHFHIHFHLGQETAKAAHIDQIVRDWWQRVETMRAENGEVQVQQPSGEGDPRSEPAAPNRDAALARLRQIKAQIESRAEGKKGERPSPGPTCIVCGKPVTRGARACRAHWAAVRKMDTQARKQQRKELLRAYDEDGPDEIEMEVGDPDPDEEIEDPDEEEYGDEEVMR